MAHIGPIFSGNCFIFLVEKYFLSENILCEIFLPRKKFLSGEISTFLPKFFLEIFYLFSGPSGPHWALTGPLGLQPALFRPILGLNGPLRGLK